MKIIILNLIRRYKIISFTLLILFIVLLFSFIKSLNPQVEYIDYYDQKLQLSNNVVILNAFDSSHEICYSGVTKIIKNGEEEILIDFPHTKELYIKGCAIDIKYISTNIIEFPICYAGGGGSGECSLALMQYHIDTKKWFFMGTKDFYVGENDFPLFLKVLKPFLQIIHLFKFENEDGKIDYSYLKGYLYGKSVADVMSEKYFDTFLYKFINYFKENYTLDNFSEFDEIYKSKLSLLSKSEKDLLLNTIHYYTDKNIESFRVYEYFDKKIISYFDKDLDNQDKKDIAKLQYIQSIERYRLEGNKYNTSIGLDLDIQKYFEEILEIEKIKRDSKKPGNKTLFF